MGSKWATQEYPLYDLVIQKQDLERLDWGDEKSSTETHSSGVTDHSGAENLIGWKFYILIRVVILYVEIKWCVHLRSVHFTVCKLTPQF